MMHPSNEQMLPQLGSLPLSFFSSTRGSPDSSDYGSGSAEILANEMLSGRVNLPADADSSMYHLRHRIQLQIEYYFSAHNLARDAFLVSHMDVDHYVLVALVAGFNCVRRLTQDFGLIIEAIKLSAKLELDDTGTKVRPRSNRSTIVIHDLPETVRKEDLEILFSKLNIGKPVNYVCADKHSWYVEFDEADEAQEALRYLREEVRDFCGKPICTRIRAIPVSGSVNAFKSADKSSGGQRVGSVHVPPLSDESVQMVRPPGDMLPTHPYPAYTAFPNPNAPYFPPAMTHPQINTGLLVWPPMPGVTYVDMYNMLGVNGMYHIPQQPNPPVYRAPPMQNTRGRGGIRRGGGMPNYNQNNQSRRGYQRSSNPNSGRNSAMSERSEHYQSTGQPSQNAHSRTGSFSSVNGIQGIVSPASTRSGSNTPPVQPEMRDAYGQTEDRQENRNSFPSPRNLKRSVKETVSNEDFHAVGHPQTVAAVYSSKETIPKFDLVSTMFPPLPGQTPSDSALNGPLPSQAVPANPSANISISAADVVRGVVAGPKSAQQWGHKAYPDSESSTDAHDGNRNYLMDNSLTSKSNSRKKEQSSSTDDLPKSGRDHGQDGRVRSDVSIERPSRANLSAGTQTSPAAADKTGVHFDHGTQTTQSSSTSGRHDRRTQALAKKSSPPEKDGCISPASGHEVDNKDGLVNFHGGPSLTKAPNDGSLDAVPDGMKNLSVENGKSGVISYARIAQLNRDKVVAPVSASGSLSASGSTRGPPVAKQTSIDSSSHNSQEDRRSVKSDRPQSGNVSKSSSFRDNRPQYDYFEDTPNGCEIRSQPQDTAHVNGNLGDVDRREDNGGEEDTEGFTAVIKHKPVRHDRYRGNAPMRYGGPGN